MSDPNLDHPVFDTIPQNLGVAPSVPAPIMAAILAASTIPAYDSEQFAQWAGIVLNKYYTKTTPLGAWNDQNIFVGTSPDQVPGSEAIDIGVSQAAEIAAAQAARWGLRC